MALLKRVVIAVAVVVALASFPAYAACNIINGQAYGDCGNVRVNNNPPVFLEVQTSRSSSGIIAGARIHAGATLTLHGMSTGTITILAGGTLYVHGMVTAQIINQGGQVIIEGTADSVLMQGGTVRISGVVGHLYGEGVAICTPGAYVNGRILPGGAC